MKALPTYVNTVLTKRVLAWMAVSLVFSALLAGCASSPSSQKGNVEAFDRALSVGKELSLFFDTAQPGSSTVVGDSPMGRNVSVTVEDHYFSASGHNCLRLQVISDTYNPGVSNNIACRRNDEAPGDWVIQRSVISMQKPQFTNSSVLGQ